MHITESKISYLNVKLRHQLIRVELYSRNIYYYPKSLLTKKEKDVGKTLDTNLIGSMHWVASTWPRCDAQLNIKRAVEIQKIWQLSFFLTKEFSTPILASVLSCTCAYVQTLQQSSGFTVNSLHCSGLCMKEQQEQCHCLIGKGRQGSPLHATYPLFGFHLL